MPKGSIQDSFQAFPSLTYIDVGSNYLTGPLPTSLGNCTAITEIHFDTRQFNGSIPASWSALVNIQLIEINSNPYLSGVIPEMSGAMKALTTFWVYSTGISGSIPTSLQNATAFVDLSLNTMFLNGS
jgi:hypothetical protein